VEEFYKAVKTYIFKRVVAVSYGVYILAGHFFAHSCYLNIFKQRHPELARVRRIVIKGRRKAINPAH